MIKFLNHFTKKEKKVFYIIILLFIVFLLFRIISNIFHLNDSYEYLDVAKRISDLSYFDSSTPNELKTKRPFVYPLFLATLIRFPIIISLCFQTLAGIISIYFLFKSLKKLGIEIKKNYLWLFIFTPSIFIYTHLVMAEWLVMLLVTIIFWLLVQKWNSKNFAYIQTITIILAFTKPVFYPLIYLNLIFFSFYFIRKKTFSFWLFIPVIILQSFMIFNKSTTGYKHFSSMENINLINYNLYYFKSNTESEKQASIWLNSVYNSEYETKNFSEKNIYLKEVAIKEIKKHFFQYSFYHFYTGVRGAFDPGRFDLMTFFKKEDGKQGLLHILNTKNSIKSLLNNKSAFIYILLIPIFFINLIKWFYFLKYLVLNKLDFKLYYIIILIASYVLISGPVNCSRYMMPFQSIIICFAILGFVQRKEIGFPH